MPKPDAKQWQQEIDQLAESIKPTAGPNLCVDEGCPYYGTPHLCNPDEEFPESLPHWAVGTTPGVLCIGAQLPTKDGRVTGNAHIVQIDVPPRGVLGPVYTILTDAGNTARMSKAEVYESFHRPHYIGDVRNILRLFDLERLFSPGNHERQSDV